MTVSELRAILADLPGDMVVMVAHPDSGWPDDICAAKVTDELHHDRKAEWPFVVLRNWVEP